MYIPAFLYSKKSHDARTEFLLSYTTICMIGFSTLFTLAIVYDYIQAKDLYTGFSPLLGLCVTGLFVSAYIANRKKYIKLALTIVSITIVTICTLAGIWWGFDLPTVLLGYILSIVLVGLVGSRNENILHLSIITTMMVLGQLYRNTIPEPVTWHGAPFVFGDIFELVIIFGAISAILVFSHRAEKTLLDRTKRTEYLLRKEKESLEIKVEQKVSELKKMQIEHLSSMYRFVEFGKLSSGLFHDLMSPIQTLKIYMESFAKQKGDAEPVLQMGKMLTISKKIETMMETMRKQIRFNLTEELFDVLQDIRDILLITKHVYLKHNVYINIVCDTPTYNLNTKRVILNHILLNLISNACEACDPAREDNTVTIRVGPLSDTTYKTYISIEDTGVGIAHDQVHAVFDNFYSTKNKQINKSMNCGIGLSSSKHALEQHLNGKLLLESEEGVGTTITLLIPTTQVTES